MSTALKPIQKVRPSTDPHLWSCYYGPREGIKQELPVKQIANALASGEGTLWVDIDTRKSEQVALIKDLFHFHPLAIEEAVNSESRVKLEEFDRCVLLIVRTIAFREATEDPYDLDTVNISFFLGKNFLVTVHGADTNPEYRDLLSSTLDSYLTQVSNRLGMATKALAVVATVTLPFVVVSGLWGMNFEHIPLHTHPHGFMILALAQLALGLTILAGLKWRKLL